MKKLFLITVSVLLINCTDDTENSINVTFEGTWKQVDVTVNGLSTKNECTEKNNITFKNDNSMTWRNHNGENCELDSIGAYVGIWEKKTETNYELTTSIGESFIIKKENNKIKIEEYNDDSRIRIFKK